MGKKNRQLNQRRPTLAIALSFLVVALFAVLPLLYFPGRAGSYVTSKEYFFIGIVDVMTILWTWLLVTNREYRLNKQNFLWLLPLFSFLILMTIAGFAGVDPKTSFFSTLENGTGLIFLYHCFLFLCILISLIRVEQDRLIKNSIKANLFASIVLAIFTFFTGDYGLFHTHSAMLNGSTGGAMMGNVLLVGAYFIFSIFLTLFLLGQDLTKGEKIYCWSGIVIMLISPVFLSAGTWKGNIHGILSLIGQARFATASLAIGVLVYVFGRMLLQKNRSWLKQIGYAGIALMIVGGVFTGIKLAQPDSTFHSYFVSQSGNRIIDWQGAFKGIKERPLLGWGKENFRVVFAKYLDPKVYDPGHGDEVWTTHPHNASIETLIDGGVFSFATYLIFIVFLFIFISRLYKAGRLNEKEVMALVALLTAYLLQNQLVFDSTVSYLLLFTVAALLIGKSQEEQSSIQTRGIGIQQLLAGFVSVSLVIIWITCALLPAQKMNEYQSVADDKSDARIDRYQHLFHSPGASVIDTDMEFYTAPLFTSYDAQKETLKANPEYKDIAVKEITAVMDSVAPLWQKNQKDYHLTLTLAQLTNLRMYLSDDYSHIADAKTFADKAIALSPTDPQIYVTKARTELYANNLSEAKKDIAQAIALNSNYKSAQEFKDIFVKAGKW